MRPRPQRGHIYRLSFEELLRPFPLEGEPDKERLVVVVSPDELNAVLSTVLVAPTTASQVERKSEMNTNVLLDPHTAQGIERPCVVQMHLLYAVNPERLGQRVGWVTDEDARDELAYALASLA